MKIYKATSKISLSLVLVLVISALFGSTVNATGEDSTITIIHKSDTGEVLEQSTIRGNIGESVEVNSKSFDGYTVSSDSSKEMTFKEDPQTVEFRYTKLEKVYLEYDSNGATKGNAPSSEYVKKGDSLIVEEASELTKDGYEFIGWNTESSGKGKDYLPKDRITLHENTTLYAQWKKLDQFTVTYSGNGNSLGKAPEDYNKYKKDDKVVILDIGNMKKGNYKFIEWNTRKDGKGKSYKPLDTFYISENLELYAIWSGAQNISKVEFHHESILSGYPDKKFRPDNYMTRAEVANVFANLSQGHYTVSKDDYDKFSDLNSESWYFNSVMWMNAKGIVTGYENDVFKPNNHITREENVSIEVKFSSLNGGNSEFIDVESDSWSKPYIDAVYSKGWIKGYSENTFRPKSNITRAEVVTIINRMLGRSADKGFIDTHMNTKYIDVLKGHWAYYEILEATQAHNYEVKTSGENWLSLGKDK